MNVAVVVVGVTTCVVDANGIVDVVVVVVVEDDSRVFDMMSCVWEAWTLVSSTSISYECVLVAVASSVSLGPSNMS